MPSARKRIIYTHDTWDDLGPSYKYFADQLPELYYESANWTHDQLFSVGSKKIFVTSKLRTENIDAVWDMKTSKVTSSSTNYYGRLSQTAIHANAATAWSNLVADTSIFSTTWSSSQPTASSIVGKQLYLIVGGPNDGKYAAVRWDLWLNFWGMETGRTSLANNFYFGLGGTNYGMCLSSAVNMYEQSSGDYPTGSASAKTKAKSPGSLIQAFSNITTTKKYSIGVSTSIVATSNPITVMISAADRDTQPTIEDGYDNDYEGMAVFDFTTAANSARFVQYFGGD